MRSTSTACGSSQQRETRRFNRATSRLLRVVVIGHSGFVTLDALRWIQDVGAGFVQLDRDANVVAAGGVERFHNTRLRRAQVLALGNEAGRRAVLDLLGAKLERQAQLAERWSVLKPTIELNRARRIVPVAEAIREQAVRLVEASDVQAMRSIEAVAGRHYWRVITRMPLRYASDLARSVPEHWHRAGSRVSLGCGEKGPRRAVSPLHAMLNYAYAILEVEASLKLQAWGFDPSVGILHADERYRPSMSADLMEPVRPIVDGLVLDLADGRKFRRGELYETRESLCRVGPPLAKDLAGLGPLRAPYASSA